MGVCDCFMFCCTLLYVHSSNAIILMGKRELVALLNLSSWCLVMVECFFLAVPRGCLRFVIVVFPDHTHLIFLWQTRTWDVRADKQIDGRNHWPTAWDGGTLISLKKKKSSPPPPRVTERGAVSHARS